MPEYLEATADKFTFRVATDRLYSSYGLWVQPVAENRVRIGLTDFMQQRSGDIAFLSVKEPATRLGVDDELAEMETVKVTQTIPSPVAGSIVDVNKTIDLTPDAVNQDPYGKGWLAVIETTSWERDRARLLDARAYLSVMQGQIEQELEKR